MQIAKVQVEGFRCLENVEVGFSDITNFIGPNCAGKSSILRALDWFFKGGALVEEDVFSGSAENKIWVQVDFDHLSDSDREKLKKYAQDGRPGRLTRCGTFHDGRGARGGGSRKFYRTHRARLRGSSESGCRTLEDQIGPFKMVIEAIVLVLNSFAVMARRSTRPGSLPYNGPCARTARLGQRSSIAAR